MHLYVATRGTLWDTQRWAMGMQSTFVPFKFRNNPHNLQEPIINGSVEIALRPIIFWEIVFPEENRDMILNTLWPTFDINNQKAGTTTHYGNIQTAKFDKVLPILRRVLGKDVVALPETFDKSRRMPCYTHNLEFFGIGMKKDPFHEGIELL